MTSKSISRRKFFKVTGLVLGGSAAACCGLGYAATQAAPKPESEPVETPSFTYGKENLSMEKPILVTYATRTGSTTGVAAAIGETLSGRGYGVEVRPMLEKPDPGEYGAVILGSAVNGGKWLPEAVEYVKLYQPTLSQIPTAMFCVHILNRGDDETSRKNRQAYLNEARSLVKPVGEGFFTGKGMDPKETSPILLWVMRLTGFIPEGDCRDWAKIKLWAQKVSI